MNHVETLHCNVSTIAHKKLQQQKYRLYTEGVFFLRDDDLKISFLSLLL